MQVSANIIYRLYNHVIQYYFHQSAIQSKDSKDKTIHKMHTFKDLYKLGSKLGSGGFGTVYKCYSRRSCTPYAVKFISHCSHYTYCRDAREDVPDEIMLWRGLEHPNIIRYIRHFLEDDQWIIVMEFCQGYEDLFNYVNTREGYLSEDKIANIMSQTLSAITYCRRHGVDHRDIKDDNILYNPKTGDIKLIDFGCASSLSPTPYTVFQGTESFHPPEWFLYGEYDSCDATVWTLGTLCFSLVNKCYPYDDITGVKWHSKKPWRNDMVSATCKRFISSCLRHNPGRRNELSTLHRNAFLRSHK